MNKTVKWIIGIVIGLLVVAVLVVAFGFMIFNHGYGNEWKQAGHMYGSFEKDFGMHDRGSGIMPYGRNLPGIRNFGNRGFFPLAGFFGGLICLGFLGLIVLGVVVLIRNLQKPAQAPKPAEQESVESPVSKEPVLQTSVSETESGKESVSVVPSSVPSAVLACSNCSYPVQEGWKHCPNCGVELQGSST